MILDATAGNQKMWKYRKNDYIVYIDIQRNLERKPTIFADNTKTPFRDKTFHTIIYDPPHDWGDTGSVYAFPDGENYNKAFPNYPKEIPTYYGMDLYRSRSELISHIWRAQKEFQRILKDDGVLWLKWVELRFTVDRALTVFTDWDELFRFHAKSPLQTLGAYSKYLLCFSKKEVARRSITLADFAVA